MIQNPIQYKKAGTTGSRKIRIAKSMDDGEYHSVYYTSTDGQPKVTTLIATLEDGVVTIDVLSPSAVFIGKLGAGDEEHYSVKDVETNETLPITVLSKYLIGVAVS